jgi:hypothetical protein
MGHQNRDILGTVHDLPLSLMYNERRKHLEQCPHHLLSLQICDLNRGTGNKSVDARALYRYSELHRSGDDGVSVMMKKVEGMKGM